MPIQGWFAAPGFQPGVPIEPCSKANRPARKMCRIIRLQRFSRWSLVPIQRGCSPEKIRRATRTGRVPSSWRSWLPLPKRSFLPRQVTLRENAL